MKVWRRNIQIFFVLFFVLTIFLFAEPFFRQGVFAGIYLDPHPACEASTPACWEDIKFNEWSCLSCPPKNYGWRCIQDWSRPACSGKDENCKWYACTGDIDAICSGNEDCEPHQTCDEWPVRYDGPCKYVCVDPGTTSLCYTYEVTEECSANSPITCFWSGQRATCTWEQATNTCFVDLEPESRSCCGPGSGVPTPTPGPAPTPTPTPTPIPTSSCTVDLNPVTASISVGALTDYFASVVPSDGTVDQVDFSSSDTGVATVNPSSDTTAAYITTATGVSVGSSTITSDVVMNGVVMCTDTSTLDVTLPGPWWQVQDADIITNGNLSSLIPTTTCLLPGCNPIFDLDGPGGYPGVPSYGGSYDFEAGSGTGTVSSTGWLANSTTTLNKKYDYSYFEGLVRPDVEIHEIIEPDGEIQGGYLISETSGPDGYIWFRSQEDLTITGTANLQDRKVVLLVDGNLYLGRPPAQSGSSIRVRDGSGFFMAIVSGDIIISPKAKIDPLTPQPVFEGIFLAEGQIKTGTEGPELDEQLWIRGSVAAYGGVVLERDLTDNSLTPAEFFEYGPDLLFTFPRDLTSRRYKWKEIAP